MDADYAFTSLSRRQLQQRCKQAGLRANTTNKEMAEALIKLAQAKQANKNASSSRMRSSTASEHKKGEHNGIESGNLSLSEPDAGRNDVEMGGEDPSDQEVPTSPGSLGSEGLQLGMVAARTTLQSSEAAKSAENHLDPEFLDEEEKLQCRDMVAQDQAKEQCHDLLTTDKPKEPDQTVASGSKHTKGSGSLVEELLAATTSEASKTVLHRKLAKSKHIGEKGREDRWKRASKKGVSDRGAVLAEKRGSLAQTCNESQESARSSEEAQELGKPGQDLAAAASEKVEPLDDNSHDRPIKVAEHEAAIALGTPPPSSQLMRYEERKKTELPVEKAPLIQQTLPNEQLKEGEGAEHEASEQSESGSQKENEPPVETPQVFDGDSEVIEPAAEPQENELERGGFTLPEVTLVGSILAEEERGVAGQLAHKGCYKSRPFSSKGVERRALAAVKKGAAQREGILTERRKMV